MKRVVAIATVIVLLSALSASASQKDIVRAIESYLTERLSPYGVEIVVDDITLRAETGGVEFDTVKIKSPDEIKPSAKVPLYVTLKKDGLVVKRLWASARVRLFTDVVIAKRSLRVREVIGASDVTVERREIRELNSGFVSSPEDVVGMVVRRPITGGRPVKRDYLRQPSVVKRGDIIPVVATSGAIRIKTRAKALEDGYPGGFINAKTSTGKVLHGRLTKDGRLIVIF